MIVSLLQNRWVQIFLAVLVLLGAGFAAGRLSVSEPEVQTVETVVEKKVIDKEAIEHAVTVAKLEWQKSQKEKIITKTVVLADGTKTEEKVEERSSEEKTSEIVQKTEIKIEKEQVVAEKKTEKQETASSAKQDYSVGLNVKKTFKDLFSTVPAKNVNYEGVLGRRLIGNVWVSGSFEIKTKEIGLGISYQF